MRSGSLRVICGPMYSRKTGELLSLVSEEQAAGRLCQVFTLDPAQPPGQATLVEHRSRGGLRARATRVRGSAEIQAQLRPGLEILAIDDAHFADPGLIPLVEELTRAGVRVHLAGLDLDFTAVPFSNVLLTLLALADKVDKRRARCVVCGEPAGRTVRLEQQAVVTSGPRVATGGTERYEARCRNCFDLRLVSGRPSRREGSSATSQRDIDQGERA